MKRRDFILNSGIGATGSLIFNLLPFQAEDCFSAIRKHNSPEKYQNINPEIELLKSNLQPTSMHMVRFLGQEIKSKVGKDIFYANVQHKDQENQPSLSTVFSSINTAYEKKKNAYDVSDYVLKGNHELIKGAMAVGFGLAPVTGGSSLIISGVAYVADKTLTQVEGMFAETARNELRRNLKTQLNDYRKNSTNSQYKALINEGNIESFRQELEKRTEPILSGALSGISPEDQDIVNSFYNKELAELMRDGFKTLNKVQRLQGAELDKNKKAIVGLSQVFITYAERNQQQLNGIVATQEELKKGLSDLNGRVGRTEKGIEFIQQQMFGKMSPGEQLASLRGGLFPDMPQDQRKDLEEKIRLVQQREDLTQSISTYLNGANEIVNIAQTLGVSSELVGKAQNVVRIGNQAFNAFTAFSSGNYLACAGAVAGIFGKGGRDVAGERHQQIMQAIGQVYEKVKVIEQKVDVMDKKLDEIKNNQKIIYDAIQAFSNEVQKNFNLVFEELQKVRRDVLYNRLVINAQFSQEYNRCEALIRDPVTGKLIIDTAQNLYPSYSELKSLFTNFGDSFNACDSRMQNTRVASKRFHPVFLMETYLTTPNSDVDRYLPNVYAPALELCKANLNAAVITIDGHPTKLKVDERISSFMCPVNTATVLDKKISNITSVMQPRFRLSFEELMDDMLAPSAVILHNNYILDAHYYYPFLTPNNENLLDYNTISSMDNVRKTGYYALFEALSITDVTIAQQTMLSGDILLPIMHSIFSRQFVSPLDIDKYYFEKIKQILSNNSILAQNFILYCVGKELFSKSNLLTYNVALGSSNAVLLKACTNLHWDLRYSDIDVLQSGVVSQLKGWSIKIGDKFYTLPDSETLADGKLICQNDLMMLLSLRGRLLEEIASYEILNDLPVAKRLGFNEFILNGI